MLTVARDPWLWGLQKGVSPMPVAGEAVEEARTVLARDLFHFRARRIEVGRSRLGR